MGDVYEVMAAMDVHNYPKLPPNTHCPECGNPRFAPHSSVCSLYTPDIHRVDGGKPIMATPETVDIVLDDALAPEDNVLKYIRQETPNHGLPAIEVSAQQGKMLETLCRMSASGPMGCTNVLEIGTLAGYSTVCLARGAGVHGHVTTIEYEPDHAQVAHVNLRYAGVHERVEVVVGDAHKILPLLGNPALSGNYRAPFDFVFIDADKESNADYFKLALPMTRQGGTIVVDNVIRDGRVIDPTRRDKLEFIKTMGVLAQTGEITASVVQTVGSKGWDGFVLAVKN